MKKTTIFLVGILTMFIPSLVNAQTIKTDSAVYGFEDSTLSCSNVTEDLSFFAYYNGNAILSDMFQGKFYKAVSDGTCAELTTQEILDMYNRKNVYYIVKPIFSEGTLVI